MCPLHSLRTTYLLCLVSLWCEQHPLHNLRSPCLSQFCCLCCLNVGPLLSFGRPPCRAFARSSAFSSFKRCASFYYTTLQACASSHLENSFSLDSSFSSLFRSVAMAASSHWVFTCSTAYTYWYEVRIIDFAKLTIMSRILVLILVVIVGSIKNVVIDCGSNTLSSNYHFFVNVRISFINSHEKCYFYAADSSVRSTSMFVAIVGDKMQLPSSLH